MANEPVLGKNVKRWDQGSPAPWNNFFEDATQVFKVDADKVIPFDVQLVHGSKNPIDFDMKSNQGAMIYRGESGESTLGVNKVHGVSTPHHEYMHGIGNYYGLGDSQEDLPMTEKERRDFKKWYGYYDPRDPAKNAREAYAENPELYKSELASHVSGYGGPLGDYERQMMQDSWEKRGPLNQWSSTQQDYLKRTPLKEAGPQRPVNMFEDYYRNTKNYLQNDAQSNALEDAFNNNPNNNRLGSAKTLIAPMVAQSLSDPQYLLKTGYRGLNKPTQKKITRKNGTVANLNLGYGTMSLDGYGGSDGPKYRNSIEERFARLGGQYMKRSDTDTFKHNAINETDFRYAMQDLLNKGPLGP